MEYKIYLDYTIELLSQIKIPSYIIDAPYTWDNQIDGGLRNNIFTQNTYMNNQENFSQFISKYWKSRVVQLHKLIILLKKNIYLIRI